jgi:hypothetical protein
VKEADLQRRIKKYLEIGGFHIEIMSCNAYQKGIPDMWVYCPDDDRAWWVDVKKPKGSTLTKSQVQKWTLWDSKGIGVWILTECDEAVLYGPPNWKEWWRPRYEKFITRNPCDILRDTE